MNKLSTRVGGLSIAVRTLRRGRAVALAGVLAGAGLVAAGGTTTAAAADPVLTNFSLSASAFSTQIPGALPPIQSGPIGAAGVGCTRFANVSAHKSATVDIPALAGVLKVDAGASHAFTEKAGDTVSSNAHNEIARVLIGNKATQALEIEGLQTRARAFHDGTRLRHDEIIRVARVTRWDNGVQTEVLSIPPNQGLNGEQLRIPGVATVTFGLKSGAAGSRLATSSATGLVVDLELTDTRVVIGSAKARIRAGAVDGIMGGAAFGHQLRGLGGNVNSGRSVLVSLPCVGTNGVYETRELLAVNVPGVVALDELLSKVKGDQGGGEASADGVSTITRAGLVGRQLVITGIRASGAITRHSDGSYSRDAGTTVASIVFQGEALTIPPPGRTLEIPGVARIQVGVVTRTATGIKVTAVRVQLLQGSAIQSTLYLANVNLNIEQG
ncbi:MAG: choice-of-anchor P family protein [Nocardioidaceae bacterium]